LEGDYMYLEKGRILTSDEEKDTSLAMNTQMTGTYFSPQLLFTTIAVMSFCELAVQVHYLRSENNFSVSTSHRICWRGSLAVSIKEKVCTPKCSCKNFARTHRLLS